MKYITKRIKIHALLALSAMVILSSCIKDLEKFPAPVVVQATTPTLANLLDAPDMTIFKAAVTRAGLMSTLANANLRYTVFGPNDAAMTSSGLPLAVVNAIPLTSLVPLVQYHIIPQTITSASIPNTFPNFQYPTIFNPAPALSALLRLTTFPSTRNGAWVNNIPITAVDIKAVNGVMHKVALVTAPPSRYLWDRINTDPDLTYLKAAIQRADSGTVAASTLQAGLQNIGANLTIFAPNNAAFQTLIFGLVYQQVFAATGNAALATAIANGAVAAGPAFLATNNVSTLLVKGIVVYHILGSRAFTNNLPTTATSYPTLLNGAIISHPGISLRVTFTGPFVSAATCKGVANATTSNVLINPTPDPGGSSDQHYLNGTIHKIDQVMLPQ